MISSVSDRFYNDKSLKIKHTLCFQVKFENFNFIIIGDSAVAGLTRYTNIWKNLFDNRFINLGISWDCVESVFWRAKDIPHLPLLQNVLILCRINNNNEDRSYDIVPNVSIAVVGIIESKLDDSVLSSEYALIIIIHLSNFNYIIPCVLFSIWLWWRAVSELMAHFFMRVFSSLPDVHVLEVFLEPILNCWWAIPNWKLRKEIYLWYWLSWLSWILFKGIFSSQSSGHCLFGRSILMTCK